MKKCCSILIILSMLISGIFPVSANVTSPDIPEGATLIFAENF